MNPLVVTGWSDLGFQPTNEQPACLPKERFAILRDGLIEAVGEENIHVFWDYPFKSCWVERHFDTSVLRPDTPTPQDRFADSSQHLCCNAIQHERTTWAMKAMELHPDRDVMIWLDIGILKQGAWRNNPVAQSNIKQFFERVKNTPPPMYCIPFPGITPEIGPVYTGKNNWRFCGSTHIWPVTFLPRIDYTYKEELIGWVDNYKTLPLDLPIWALVEQYSGLPFQWYAAEYDASQLDNYPYGREP